MKVFYKIGLMRICHRCEMLLSSSVCLYVKDYAMIFIPSWSRQFLILLYGKVSMKPFNAFNLFCKLLWREKEEERREVPALKCAGSSHPGASDSQSRERDQAKYARSLILSHQLYCIKSLCLMDEAHHRNSKSTWHDFTINY